MTFVFSVFFFMCRSFASWVLAVSDKASEIYGRIFMCHGAAHDAGACGACVQGGQPVFVIDAADGVDRNVYEAAYLLKEGKAAGRYAPFAVSCKNMSGSEVGTA